MPDFPDHHERAAALRSRPLRKRIDLTIEYERLVGSRRRPCIKRQATGTVRRDENIPASGRRSLGWHRQESAAQHTVCGYASDPLLAGPVRQANALQSFGTVNRRVSHEFLDGAWLACQERSLDGHTGRERNISRSRLVDEIGSDRFGTPSRATRAKCRTARVAREPGPTMLRPDRASTLLMWCRFGFPIHGVSR